VYERFAGRMFRLCLRYLKQEMEAEDAVVEGFVKVFRKLDTFEFRGEGSFEAWISRIMVNESLMMLRKRKDVVSVDQNEAIQLDSGLSTDSDIRAEDLYALVRQLPDGYRTVFNLYAIEGFAHKEIAEMLGISENTSKTQLFKARAALQSLLEKYGIRQ
jgi:RNA polymerase sigma-70 factor (ECF subfamily)